MEEHLFHTSSLTIFSCIYPFLTSALSLLIHICVTFKQRKIHFFTPNYVTLSTDLPSASIHVKTTCFHVNGMKTTQHSLHSPSQSIISHVLLSLITSYSSALEGIRKSVHCYIIISINPLITSALCTNVNVSAICSTQ